MNKVIRNIFIFIVIIIFMLAFSPSYVSLNINNLSYVVAMAVDVGQVEKFKITFQFTKGNSGGESGSSYDESSIIMNSVEASSIDNAINLMSSYMAKEINLSHCKAIIFSEEVAVQGISNEIYTLFNNPEIRPSSNIVISKCKAEEYVKNVKPVFGSLITKYYEIFPNSNKYTGYVYNVTLGDFFNQLVCHTCEPFAILGGVSTTSSNADTNDKATNIYDIKSTNTTFSGEQGAENLGVAVFKEDKLVGELSALETLCLSIIRGDVNSFLITVPNPEDTEKQIDLIMYPSNKKSVKVDIINNSPYISVDVSFIGKISSVDEGSRYLDTSILSSISQNANRYLEEIILQFLYKTSTEFSSDINAFGKHALSNFLTVPEFEDYNWRNSYANSTFKVSINSEIESGLLITES